MLGILVDEFYGNFNFIILKLLKKLKVLAVPFLVDFLVCSKYILSVVGYFIIYFFLIVGFVISYYGLFLQQFFDEFTDASSGHIQAL